MGLLSGWRKLVPTNKRPAFDNVTEDHGLPSEPNCKLSSRIIHFDANHVQIAFWMSGQQLGVLTFSTDNFMHELAAFTNLFVDDPWEAVGDRADVEKRLAAYGYPVTEPKGIPRIENPESHGYF